MLLDSVHIQEHDIEWKNRKRIRAGKTLLKPLYAIQEAEANDSLAWIKKR